MRASMNNRASTVLEVFLEAVTNYGLPSRGRGDRGRENTDVSVFMILACGPNRASFMWGSCVWLLMAMSTKMNLQLFIWQLNTKHTN